MLCRVGETQGVFQRPIMPVPPLQFRVELQSLRSPHSRIPELMRATMHSLPTTPYAIVVLDVIRCNGRTMRSCETRASDTYLVFIVSQPELVIGGYGTAYEVLEHRLMAGIWGLNKHTTCRKLVKQGAKVVFYTAGEGRLSRHFVATADVLASPMAFSDSDLPRYTRIEDWFFDIPAELVQLSNIRWLEAPVSVYALKSQMKFFKNRNAIQPA